MLLKFQSLLKNFKLTLHCNILKVRGKIDYPESILPKQNFCNKIDFNLLLASNKYIYLLRRSEKSLEQTFQLLEGSYLLRLDSISNERLPKLSINLLGAFFKKEHLKYIVAHNKPGGAKWRNNKKILFKFFFKDYSITDVGCEIYLHANNIDGKTFPFSYPYSKDNVKVVREFEQAVGCGILKPIADPADPTKSFYQVSGTVKLVHDPLVLNYWHVEMITKNFNDKEVKSASPVWTETFFKSIMSNVIRVNAYNDVVEVGKIHNSIFLN